MTFSGRTCRTPFCTITSRGLMAVSAEAFRIRQISVCPGCMVLVRTTESGGGEPSALSGTIAPFSADLATYYGALATTPGGNSTGSDTVWYDFDAENHTITVTWDDVGHYGYSASNTPEYAFQLQLVGDGTNSGAFDIVYRYEAIGDNSGSPFYNAQNGNYVYPAEPAGGWTALPTTPGNTGVAGLDVIAMGTVLSGASDSTSRSE